MNRISTASVFDTGISTLQMRKGDLNKAQQQLTSGKRISRLSDDPMATGQLAAIRAHLLRVANRGDGGGGYLFSGQGVGSPPFVDARGGATYGATSGTTHTASSEPLPPAPDGRAAFLEARGGHGVS